MQTRFNSTPSTRRLLLVKIALVALTVCLVVWSFPHDAARGFNHDVGKPWMYGTFIAKFDFPVFKTEEVQKAERDSVLAMQLPYYRINPAVEREQVAKFIKDYGDGVPELGKRATTGVVARLHRLYREGVMSTSEYNRLARDTTASVRIVSDKSVETVLLADLHSALSAYESLFPDDLTPHDRAALQNCNLSNYIEPNCLYDKKLTETERNDLLATLTVSSNMVLAGQKVIDRGEIVDDYIDRVLTSYEREMKRRGSTEVSMVRTMAGQILYVGLFVVLFTIYLSLFRRDYFGKPRAIAMLYAMIVVAPAAVSFMMSHAMLNVYVLPMAMVPIFARVFLDSRTAFFVHTVVVLICAAAVHYQYEFIIIELTTGIVAIYSLRELSRRAQVLWTAFAVAAADIAVYTALQLMQNNDVQHLDMDIVNSLAASAVLVLLAYPLMYVLERTFGFTSNVTLFELANTNSGLLRDLSETAPGTFQHSTTVGNLAAEIAKRIGADAALVRTGALYHDIGKMHAPVFYTENQAGVNPHDNMPYTESARIIIAHVTEGVKMAEKAALPAIITDFIRTHHGAGRTKYFYLKARAADPDTSPEPYTYPGPDPQTREQAILMMADSVEAASRSLTEYTEESIAQLVARIVDAQVADGRFRECPITFKDIADAKRTLAEKLKAIYHTRIQYPEELKGKN